MTTIPATIRLAAVDVGERLADEWRLPLLDRPAGTGS